MKEEGNPRTKSDKPLAETDIRLALETFRDGIYRSFQVCFPACVYSYDKASHKATLMPLVKQGYYNGKWNYKNRPLIKDVTVRNIQCGGFTIEIPIHIGDTGWVFSSDRDTQLIKQVGALTNSVLDSSRPIKIVEDDYQQEPNQLGLHDFTQGFFLPDNWGAFETWRYKDNPNIAVGEGLYIGSSIGTDDGRDDVDEKKYQHGDAYEKKTTSSIVLQSNGGVSMASSSEDEVNQNAHVFVDRNKIEAVAEDRNNNKTTSLIVDTEKGMSIRQDDEQNKRHFVCNIDNGSFLLRMMDGDNIMSFSYVEGKLNVSTAKDINVNIGGNTNFRCAGEINVVGDKKVNVHTKGDINAMVEGNAKVTASNARVIAEKTASVSASVVSASAMKTANINSGETVNIGAAKTTNINAGEVVNLASGKKINVTAPDEVTIVTGNKTTVMAKKKQAKILVTTLSKDSTIDVVAEGKGSNLNVVMKGTESPIGITTEQEKSPISIVTKGRESAIQIKAEGVRSDITLTAQNKAIIESRQDVEVKANGTVVVSSPKIIENGAVEINGALKLNGQPFAIAEQNKVKHWIAP